MESSNWTFWQHAIDHSGCLALYNFNILDAADCVIGLCSCCLHEHKNVLINEAQYTGILEKPGAVWIGVNICEDDFSNAKELLKSGLLDSNKLTPWRNVEESSDAIRSGWKVVASQNLCTNRNWLTLYSLYRLTFRIQDSNCYFIIIQNISPQPYFFYWQIAVFRVRTLSLKMENHHDNSK